jgi:hypothetical protein
MLEHLGYCETDVFGDLTQKYWRNVAARVKWDRRRAARTVAKLFMRTTLPHFGEAQPSQNRYDFGGFEDWNITHDSGDCDVLHSDKLRFKNGIAIFKKH